MPQDGIPSQTREKARRTSLLNVMQQPQVKSLLKEAEEKFAEEEGLSFKPMNMQFQKPAERDFTAADRPHTTLLFGGLTFRHEHLIRGAWQSLGYKTEVIPTPNTDAFQAGKEYGNNGQCNPTYFTVGNLVNYLIDLRDNRGMTTPEIIEQYVFLTAGACGPCRFGMYEAEFRLALRNAGFDGFRVILFQQKGGLKQGDMEAGLKMNLDFFMGLLNAFNAGDLLNEVSNQIRPYEVEAGATDEALNQGVEYLYQVMKSHQPATVEGKWAESLKGKRPGTFDLVSNLTKFVDQLTTEDYTEPLRNVGGKFDDVVVDKLQPKPVVKITGEFWAQTTEGDGNFNMFRFLQSEGAEIIVEPVATWIAYMLWQGKIKTMDREGLTEASDDTKWWDVRAKAQKSLKYVKTRAALAAGDKIFRREYGRMAKALGGTAHEIVDMWEMEELAHEFYHSRSEGGEGHLEVSKNIYYTVANIAHMVLSLKPFGCMPSTQSDGAQSAVINKYKDMIYLPIETSGEGEINAHSRVQMALGEAKAKCKLEFQEALDTIGYDLDQLYAYVDQNPELKRPMYHAPRYAGIVGTAAHFAYHLSERMQAQGISPNNTPSGKMPAHAAAH